MTGPVFKTIPTGVKYTVSPISLSGTLQGTSTVTPNFFHYLANGTKETVSILAAGTYSFEVVRDSRWNNDGSYLTVIGSITYLDGTKKDLVGRLNTYMGGVIFSEGPFDFSSNDFLTNSFDSFLNVGQFAPGNNADLGKKFSFSIAQEASTYSITKSTSTANEGSSITFQITTSSVEWGSSLNYSISGISAADLSNAALNGSTTVVQNGTNGATTITITTAADQISEGSEILTLNVMGATASVTINDTSFSAPYNSSSLKYIGAESLNFDLTANSSLVSGLNFSTGSTQQVWVYPGQGTSRLTITDISQFSNVSGLVFTTQNKLIASNEFVAIQGFDGSTYVIKIVDPSRRTDGDGLDGVTYNVWQFVPSTAPPTYSLTANKTSVDEGFFVTFTLSTSNLASGTSVPYTLSGISPADISSASPTSGTLSGTTTIGSNGQAVFSVLISPDGLSEGVEFLTVTAQGASQTVTINDTSFSAPYNSSGLKYIGAESLNFDLTANSSLVSGLNFSTGSTQQVWVYPGQGTSRLTITDISQFSNVSGLVFTTQNKLIASNEFVAIQGFDGSTYVIKIVDPSRRTDGDGLDGVTYNVWQFAPPATYALSAGSTSIDEGSSVTFTLSTTNLASGTSVPYTLSGISGADISGGSLSGNAIINASGVATVSVTLLNDLLTEGQETLTITAGGATASTVINDTSTSLNLSVINHNLSVLVDKGILGANPLLLKDLIESETYSNGTIVKHTIQYAGINFDYVLIDSLFTTITRDGEFTSEFNREINDYVQSEANITYKVAVALVGALNIDNIIIMVAGSDGNFVG